MPRPVEVRPGLWIGLTQEVAIRVLDVRLHADRVASMDGSVRPVKLSVSMERVDNRTGGTSSGGTGTITVSGDG